MTTPLPGLSTNRVEAFSDGVLAIAITLLILDVKVPVAEEGDLAAKLAHQWPSYTAYALTFLVIGIMWVNHHYLFDQVDRHPPAAVPEHPSADEHRLPALPDRPAGRVPA